MKKIILSIIILFFSNIITVFSHVEHYKDFNYLEYELFRNNKLIGTHKYNFNRNGNNLQVKSVVNFQIKKLNVVLYKYFAESEENYKDSKFHSFSSKTKQNKKDKYVKVTVDKEKNKLNIDGSSYKGEGSIDDIVGTWWNHEIVKSKAQISAISGRIIDQTVTFKGKEIIKIGENTFETLHFNFKSSDQTLPDSKKLNTDIWYDEKTFLWVKASFIKSGNWEYRLKKYK